jgi:hypothetical protein
MGVPQVRIFGPGRTQAPMFLVRMGDSDPIEVPDR